MDNERTIRGLLTRAATGHPEAPALAAPDASGLTYAELLDCVDGVGALLAEAGIGPGDRVAIALPNGIDLAVAMLGVCSYAVAAPLHPHSPVEQVHGTFEALGIAAVLAPLGSPAAEAAEASDRALLRVNRGGLVGTLRRRPRAPGAPLGPTDVALVLRTSGTTGAAKTVPLRGTHLTASAAAIARWLRLDRSDRCLNVMPLFHIHGFVAGMLAQLAVSGVVICAPGLHAAQFLRWLQQTQPTWYTAAPSMHHAVVKRIAGERPSHALRFIRSASAPLPVTLAAELQSSFGVPVIEAYGMTEAAHQIASNPLPPGVRKPRSVGTPVGCEVAILDASGERMGPGKVGDVVARGPAVFDGYEGDHPTGEVFRDGWFNTGDRGYLDDDGCLFLVGRSKEMINRGGETIAPREVDDVLLASPAVAEAVAFALPDPHLGETVAAAVVPAGGAIVDTAELQAFAAARLPRPAVPERIVVVPALPTGATGKVQRIGLAEQLAAHLTTSSEAAAERRHRAPVTDVERLITGIWSEVLEVDTVYLDDRFRDLGGDSILAEQVHARLQSALGTTLPAEQLFLVATVAEQALLVNRLRSEPNPSRAGRS